MNLLAHIGALFSARMLAPIFRMVLVVGIARILGVEGLGNYQTVMAQYAVFESLISLGLWSFTIREIAADRSRAGTILLHGCTLSLAVAIPASLGLYLVSLGYTPEIRRSMLIMCLALWPAGISTYCDSVFLAFERAGCVAAAMLGEECVLMAAACACLWFGCGLPVIIAVVVGARIGGAVVRTSLAIPMAGAVEWRLDRAVIGHLLWNAPVFFSTSLLWTLFWRMDVLMLSWFSTAEAVGLYAAALRIVTTLQEVPKAIAVALFPRFVTLYVASRSEFRRLYVRTGAGLFAFALVACVGITTVGGYALTLAFSDKFTRSVPVLNLLVWTLVPFSITNLFGNMLISSHNQNADLVINGISLGVIVLLNALLIPAYGALGAAGANLGAVTAGLALRAAFSWGVGMLSAQPRGAADDPAGAGVLRSV